MEGGRWAWAGGTAPGAKGWEAAPAALAVDRRLAPAAPAEHALEDWAALALTRGAARGAEWVSWWVFTQWRYRGAAGRSRLGPRKGQEKWPQKEGPVYAPDHMWAGVHTCPPMPMHECLHGHLSVGLHACSCQYLRVSIRVHVCIHVCVPVVPHGIPRIWVTYLLLPIACAHVYLHPFVCPWV